MRRGFQVSDISSVECEVLIICSTYNQEKFLADALEGFVSQKASFPFLALVHDDASTDGTADVIRLFGGFCGRDSGIGPAQRAKTTIWN